MARYRTLKPEFFADEKLGECSHDARLLFIGLWCFCDDSGRKQYSPTRIRREVFPDDDLTTADVERWLAELDHVGVIWRYEIDEEEYLWLPNFVRHQRIDRPSHTDLPPHPDDPQPLCLCRGCRADRGEDVSGHYRTKTNGRPPKRGRNKRKSVPVYTQGVVPEHSGSAPRVVPDNTPRIESPRTPSSSSKSSVSTEYIRFIHTGSTPEFEVVPETPNPQGNRHTQSAVVDELARGIFDRLGIPPTANILNTLQKSIEVRARSQSSTVELSAAQILAKAAGVLKQAQPEDWELWFADARYEYVNAGDPRLADRHVWARERCGGTRCENGWETVTVDDHKVLRRCTDCVKLWGEW